MAANLDLIITAQDRASGVFRNIENSSTSAFDRVKKALVPAAIGLAAGAAATLKFADAAGDLAEATNKAQVTFGESTRKIEEFAQTSAKSFGLSRRAANEYAGTMGVILQTSGLSEKATADMSVELVKLAADMASFNNIPIDVALEKIRAGLVGETEPLRTVGVLLSAATVEAKAFELGLAGADGELTEGAKVQARYALIMEQTAKQQGDFARTSDSLANQQRILSARFEDLQAQLGTKMIPVVLKVIELFNALPADLQVAAVGALAFSAAVGPMIPLLTALPGLIIAVGGALTTLTLNPVGAAIVGIGLLAAGIAVLILHWDDVERKIQGVNRWMQEHRAEMTALAIAITVLTGPLGLVIGPIILLTTHMELATNVVKTLVGWVNKLADAIKSLPSIPDITPGFNVPVVPGLQHGGIVTSPTLALIAERGPEAVIPLTGQSAPGISAGFDMAELAGLLEERFDRLVRHLFGNLRIEMDGREVGRLTARELGREADLLSRTG